MESPDKTDKKPLVDGATFGFILSDMIQILNITIQNFWSGVMCVYLNTTLVLLQIIDRVWVVAAVRWCVGRKEI